MAQQHPRVIQGLYRLGPAFISGTFATLYSAQDLATDEPVAVLLAQPPAELDRFRLQSLLQPLKALTGLLHPHLLHLRDAGIDGGECFAVTDLRGRTLRELMNTQAFPLERALEITRQLAHGAGALHARGVYGLDLRPDRIHLETRGRIDTALIDDVGLQRFLWSLGYNKKDSAEEPLIRLDPRYAAPEQLQQQTSSPATDIYALGLLLFEIAAGRLPFVGSTSAETRALQLSAPLPNLIPLRGTALPELQSFVERALAKHPSLRFADTEAFCDALALVQATYEKHEPAAGTSAARRRFFQTAPMEALKRGATTRPAPVPPPSAALRQRSPDPEESEATIASPKEEEEEETLQIPGRARLLIGQSERKKVILIKQLPAILGRTDPRKSVKPNINLAPYDSQRSISRQHARIVREGDLFYIEDLQSVNKTWLGELELRPYERQLLRRHDRIQLGLLELIFEY